MTDANLTELICVLDRSGSMAAIIDDAIGGFNALLDDQKKQPGKALMTIAMFDHAYKVVAESKPIASVEPFTRNTYKPRGSTALLDAVGRTIDDTGRRYANLPEDKRPGKVMFVILTDGAENSSQQYNHAQVSRMIETQTNEYKWEFVYLSADVNAFADAQALRIQTCVSWQPTSGRAGGQSVMDTFAAVSSNAAQYRKDGTYSIRNQSVSLDEIQSGESSTSDSTDVTGAS